MTLEQILIQNGVSEENAKKIVADMKSNKIFTATEENLDVRYGKLKTDHDSLVAKDAESQKLIEELQKANKGNEGIQQQITDYQSRVQDLEAELKKTRTNEAFKVAFATEGVVDIDYLMYQIGQDASSIKYDDQGNVSNVKEMVDSLKTKCPAQFKAINKKVDPKKLPDDGKSNEVTKEQFNKMSYSQRLSVFNENPDLYNQLKD